MRFDTTKQLTLTGLLVLSGMLVRAQALEAPAINCLAVDEDGNVIVNYEQPADPNAEFTEYHIHFANNLGFIGGDEIILNDYNNTSFVHTGASPELSPVCYYITAASYDGVSSFMSEPSDTLCTIFLQAQPSVSPQGYAQLQWNSPYPYGPPSAGLIYTVWMEYPVGIWTQVVTLPYGTNNYDHEVSVCDEWLNFQVMLQAPDGCVFTSNIAGNQFIDAVPPAIPVVASVSVDHVTQDAVVSWEQDPSPDTQGYIIYECNGAIVSTLDTVYGIGTTVFNDILANTATGSVSYLVAAFDTCYSGVPPSPNTSPTTDICNASVFLTILPFVECDLQIDLAWTPYEGWPDGVGSYDVMFSTDNVSYSVLATVPGDQLEYSHLNILLGLTHYYYIVAHASVTGYSAQSNLRSLYAQYPDPPLYIYTVTATVTAPDQVSVEAIITPTVSHFDYFLERQREGDTYWKEITSVTAVFSSNLSFTDNINLKTDVFSYTYRIIAVNACGTSVDTSNVGRTILLRGLANNDRMTNTLIWSDYADWQAGVQEYTIYRRIGATGSLDLLATVPSSVGFFEDDVSDYYLSDGEFCYVVEATELPGAMGTNGISLSNEICLQQDPRIWIPNAFVVNGFNSTFSPVIAFADFSSFEMAIFSKWGDILFHTTDYTVPWDGKMDDKVVQEGYYGYYISVKDGEGKLHEQRGTVTMLIGAEN